MQLDEELELVCDLSNFQFSSVQFGTLLKHMFSEDDLE